MWIIMILIILSVVTGAGWWIKICVERTEEKKYYAAAARMLRESCLDQIIRSRGTSRMSGRRIMVCVKTKRRHGQSFVFDLDRGVRIGRGQNEICVQDRLVSASHCCLYNWQGQPVVQDFNSANGTWIKRGLKRYRIEGVQRVFSGDRLLVGGTCFELRFFTFDLAQL